MRFIFLAVLFLSAVSTKGLLATDVGKPTMTVRDSKFVTLQDGRMSIPITVKNITSLKACYLMVSYEGYIISAEFVPTTYLHEPVVIPPKIDNENKAVMIALAATDRVVTRDPEGIVGHLVIDGSVIPKSVRVVEAEFLDEDDKILSSVESGSGPTLGPTDDTSGATSSEALETRLFQSHPNPANPVSTISFSLKNRSYVTLRIYNVSGQLVRTLVNEELNPNTYDIVWDAMDNGGNRVSSGIYFYRLMAGAFVDQKKLVILK